MRSPWSNKKLRPIDNLVGILYRWQFIMHIHEIGHFSLDFLKRSNILSEHHVSKHHAHDIEMKR